MFTRLQIVSRFSERSRNEQNTGARARLASRVLLISRDACVGSTLLLCSQIRCYWIHLPISMPLENGNVMWSCCLIKGLEKPFSESIDYAKQKKSKKVETAVHVCLIPAQETWFYACLGRWWPHGVSVRCKRITFGGNFATTHCGMP